VLYVATGSNLLESLFPAILVNVGLVLSLAFAVGWMVRLVSFPKRGTSPWGFVAVLGTVVIVLNVVVATTRSGWVVSLLLAVHLALMTLIPLLGAVMLFRRMINDFLHPVESVGLCVVAVAAWVALSFVDTPPWEYFMPILVFAVGLPVFLIPRLFIGRAEAALRYGDAVRALELAGKYGLDGRQYFAATCIEMDALLSMGELDRLEDFTRRALAAARWPRANREAIELHLLLADVLRGPGETARHGVERFVTEARVSKAGRLVASSMLLYLDARQLEAGGSAEVFRGAWSAERVDGLLRELHASAMHRLPGVPPTRTSRSHAVLRAAAFLALAGAMMEARFRGDEAARAALWRDYGRRNGLAIHLLREIIRIDQQGSGL
jgi:hypothetical protein